MTCRARLPGTHRRCCLAALPGREPCWAHARPLTPADVREAVYAQVGEYLAQRQRERHR